MFVLVLVVHVDVVMLMYMHSASSMLGHYLYGIPSPPSPNDTTTERAEFSTLVTHDDVEADCCEK